SLMSSESVESTNRSDESLVSFAMSDTSGIGREVSESQAERQRAKSNEQRIAMQWPLSVDRNRWVDTDELEVLNGAVVLNNSKAANDLFLIMAISLNFDEVLVGSNLEFPKPLVETPL